MAGGTAHHSRRTTILQYSALAITVALTMRAVFHLALRQTEGLIGSVITLLGLTLTVPDHSTMPPKQDVGSASASPVRNRSAPPSRGQHGP